jgi:NAD(P)-dependent dehydrogenase (short-subunit alcohol dehydrogenase family)
MVVWAVEVFGSLDCVFNNVGIFGGCDRLFTADY